MDKVSTKEQTLSVLYSIRAGLSTISIQKEDLCSKENKIKSSQDALIETKNSITQNIESSKSAVQKSASLSNEIKHKPKGHFKIDRFAAILASILMGGLFSVGGVIVGIIGTLIVAFVSEFFFGHDMVSAVGDGSHFGFLLLNVGVVVGLVTLVVGSWIWFGYRLESIKKAQNTEMSENAKLQSDLSSEKYNIQALSNNKALLESKSISLAKQIDNYIVEYNEAKSKIIHTVKVIYDVLTNEYSRTLDPRDWQNLDLIIFYYETGRADTIKEALQQVDRQRQLDTLVSAIQEATKSICRSIERTINTLKADINNCFSRLSTQLHNQHIEQIQTLNSIVSSNAAVKESIKSIGESINLQNALLTKIEASSVQLVNDADYVLFYKKPEFIS